MKPYSQPNELPGFMRQMAADDIAAEAKRIMRAKGYEFYVCPRCADTQPAAKSP